MSEFLAQVVMPYRTGLPADIAVNQFAFSSDDTIATAHAAVTTRLEDFYNAADTGYAISQLLSGALDRGSNAAEIRYFDLAGHLDGSAHGSPVFIDNWTVGAISGAASAPLPEECALCLSFHADYATDPEFSGVMRPRARDRGRVYIGPLNNVTGGYDTNGRSTPGATVATSLGEAGTRLADSGAASLWCVWSRVDSALKEVVAGWVDDAFDTQRRRGPEATARVLWTA
jgi:hypothetical protein